MDKKKVLILVGILVLLLSAFGIYKVWVTPKPNKDVKLDDKIAEVENDTKKIAKLKTPKEKMKYIEDLNKRYSKPESAVEYLVVQSMRKDTNMFPDAFISETFNNDIYGNPEPDKLKLIESIMDRLTRKGTLKKIEHKEIKWTLDNKSVRVISDFYYKDLKNPIRLNILVTKKENEAGHEDEAGHGDNFPKTDFYYVNTSVWDLIQTIEKGAQ